MTKHSPDAIFLKSGPIGYYMAIAWAFPTYSDYIPPPDPSFHVMSDYLLIWFSIIDYNTGFPFSSDNTVSHMRCTSIY